MPLLVEPGRERCGPTSFPLLGIRSPNRLVVSFSVYIIDKLAEASSIFEDRIVTLSMPSLLPIAIVKQS